MPPLRLWYCTVTRSPAVKVAFGLVLGSSAKVIGRPSSLLITSSVAVEETTVPDTEISAFEVARAVVSGAGAGAVLSAVCAATAPAMTNMKAHVKRNVFRIIVFFSWKVWPRCRGRHN